MLYLAFTKIRIHKSIVIRFIDEVLSNKINIMINETKIQLSLKNWLSEYFFKKTTLLVKEEVSFKVDEFRMSADLIVIQSKSNVIHGFEIKSVLNSRNLQSSIWQTYSYYTNYKWLVIPFQKVNLFNNSLLEQIHKLGLGIITFDENGGNFKIWKDAKYIDGNFLKFLPELENEWVTINKIK